MACWGTASTFGDLCEGACANAVPLAGEVEAPGCALASASTAAWERGACSIHPQMRQQATASNAPGLRHLTVLQRAVAARAARRTAATLAARSMRSWSNLSTNPHHTLLALTFGSTSLLLPLTLFCCTENRKVISRTEKKGEKKDTHQDQQEKHREQNVHVMDIASPVDNLHTSGVTMRCLLACGLLLSRDGAGHA